MAAPITGKPCFLYHTTVWQQRKNKKQEWEKIADETLHLPFFIDDSTGQLLIEPLGAELDLHRDFREEYDVSYFSSNLDNVSPRVNVFLSRHSVVPAGRLRIEERSIKPGDPLFAAGTLTENPGVVVHPFLQNNDFRANKGALNPKGNNSNGQISPQIIRLQSGAIPSTTQEMSQQEKIAAALTRAGITKPEAWSAAGVPFQVQAIRGSTMTASIPEDPEASPHKAETGEEQSSFNLTPPVVLMKGTNDPTFVISYRSQKEFVVALAWKSAAMILGGATVTMLGIYMLTTTGS